MNKRNKKKLQIKVGTKEKKEKTEGREGGGKERKIESGRWRHDRGNERWPPPGTGPAAAEAAGAEAAGAEAAAAAAAAAAGAGAMETALMETGLYKEVSEEPAGQSTPSSGLQLQYSTGNTPPIQPDGQLQSERYDGLHQCLLAGAGHRQSQSRGRSHVDGPRSRGKIHQQSNNHPSFIPVHRLMSFGWFTLGLASY